MPRLMKPSDIVRLLDEHVVGQDEAKKTLAVAIYTHYRKMSWAANSAVDIMKSNILLIGPTGTGKTLLCETLARVLDVPFVTADATSLAQTEFVSEEIEAILQRLLDRAGGDLTRAQHGIVFIDEIDKLKAASDQARAASGESVQHALLKIMEGSPVRLRTGHIDTTHILFICGGAFVGLDKILEKTHTFGFITTSDNQNEKIVERLNSRVKPTDLRDFGLIPEFAGRLPIVARLNDLTRDMLVRIMIEPRNAIYRQFAEILRENGVELRIARLVFEQIAELAIEYKAGARSLRGIFEEMMTDVLYAIPDHPGIRQVVITSLFEPPQLLSAPQGDFLRGAVNPEK
ncbi:ATP-dependent Clp protease ATP-binding subunit ClpX [Dechloromonas sp.]|uniref:ATP-dependent Clp protease ATP-binding subunit ClpX n=1 Tax=Dechloromonas sp. TaxID=1917218 RepID=UPI0011F547DF|nr:ATP-dependent Clp protease ATP-binding subunit ClpX [Dechloromonas sp.]MBU3695762.1 ATP-dependent Clp protease ATP-binding subunit ClpX [Dechloromonas sp.]TEX46263.1 MAG: ATP-dependent protease ATP-binding subunit ClpX [Rhodocyclaceae bacterium]